MSIYYPLSHGYHSKIDEKRMFKNQEDVRKHDLQEALDFFGYESVPAVGGDAHKCLRFLADYLDSMPVAVPEAAE